MAEACPLLFGTSGIAAVFAAVLIAVSHASQSAQEPVCPAGFYRESALVWPCENKSTETSFLVGPDSAEDIGEIPRNLKGLKLLVQSENDGTLEILNPLDKGKNILVAMAKAPRTMSYTWQNVIITTDLRTTKPWKETVSFFGVIPNNLKVKLANNGSQKAVFTISYSYSGWQNESSSKSLAPMECPSSTSGCAQYDGQKSMRIVDVFSKGLLTKYSSYSSPWASMPLDSYNASSKNTESGRRRRTKRRRKRRLRLKSVEGEERENRTNAATTRNSVTWDQWKTVWQSWSITGTHSSEWKEAFHFIDSLQTVDGMVSKAEFEKAFNFHKAYESLCIWSSELHGAVNGKTSAEAWAAFALAGVDEEKNISRVKWASKWDHFLFPGHVQKAASSVVFPYLDMDDDGFVTEAEFAMAYTAFYDGTPITLAGMSTQSPIDAELGDVITTTTQPASTAVSTVSKAAVSEGATTMKVASQEGFKIGSSVDISPGTAAHEVAVLQGLNSQGLNSMAFESPLKFAHPSGSRLVVKAKQAATGASTTTGCFYRRTSYQPKLAGVDSTTEASAKACQWRCRQHSGMAGGCAHFVFWETNGACALYGQDAQPEADNAAISGPPDCVIEARSYAAASAALGGPQATPGPGGRGSSGSDGILKGGSSGSSFNDDSSLSPTVIIFIAVVVGLCIVAIVVCIVVFVLHGGAQTWKAKRKLAAGRPGRDSREPPGFYAPVEEVAELEKTVQHGNDHLQPVPGPYEQPPYPPSATVPFQGPPPTIPFHGTQALAPTFHDGAQTPLSSVTLSPPQTPPQYQAFPRAVSTAGVAGMTPLRYSIPPEPNSASPGVQAYAVGSTDAVRYSSTDPNTGHESYQWATYDGGSSGGSYQPPQNSYATGYQPTQSTYASGGSGYQPAQSSYAGSAYQPPQNPSWAETRSAYQPPQNSSWAEAGSAYQPSYQPSYQPPQNSYSMGTSHGMEYGVGSLNVPPQHIPSAGAGSFNGYGAPGSFSGPGSYVPGSLNMPPGSLGSHPMDFQAGATGYAPQTGSFQLPPLEVAFVQPYIGPI